MRRTLLHATAWSRLAWFDIRSRYRRTFLGPFWIVVTTAITVSFLGAVYGGILGIDWVEYIPYVAAGIVIWTFISTILIETSTALVTYRHCFHSIPMSAPLPVVRIVVRNQIIFLHNWFVCLGVALVCDLSPGIQLLWILPAFIVYSAAAVSGGLINAFVCTRFRDVQSLVVAVVGILFLITPIVWRPGMLPGNRRLIASVNPFTHYLAIMRDAFLGLPPSKTSWGVVLVITGLMVVVAYVSTRMTRGKLIFWL